MERAFSFLVLLLFHFAFLHFALPFPAPSLPETDERVQLTFERVEQNSKNKLDLDAELRMQSSAGSGETASVASHVRVGIHFWWHRL